MQLAFTSERDGGAGPGAGPGGRRFRRHTGKEDPGGEEAINNGPCGVREAGREAVKPVSAP